MSVSSTGFDINEGFVKWVRFWNPEAADVLADHSPVRATLISRDANTEGMSPTAMYSTTLVFSGVPKNAAGFDVDIMGHYGDNAIMVLPARPELLVTSPRPLDHAYDVTPANLMAKLAQDRKPVKLLVDPKTWPYLPDPHKYEGRQIVMAVTGWEAYMILARFEHCELVRFDRDELAILAPTIWWPEPQLQDEAAMELSEELVSV